MHCNNCGKSFQGTPFRLLLYKKVEYLLCQNCFNLAQKNPESLLQKEMLAWSDIQNPTLPHQLTLFDSGTNKSPERSF